MKFNFQKNTVPYCKSFFFHCLSQSPETPDPPNHFPFLTIEMLFSALTSGVTPIHRDSEGISMYIPGTS